MIERVEIRNWQSLRDVDLTLGRFTVIQGPSNSGKSAFMRALRAIASNVRGAGHLTRGTTTAMLTAYVCGGQVTLEYGKPNAKAGQAWFYRITAPDGTEERYTSLAGAVPADVTQALRIAPVAKGAASLNFAGQFDGPFLLEETGSSVARVLGELTNVDRILQAVREANRRKASYAATLKAREDDLADLKARAALFRDLPAKLARCDAAESLAENIAGRVDQVDRLQAATEALVVAESILERSRVLPEVPTDARVLAAQARLTAFTDLIRTLTTTNNAAATATAQADQLRQEEVDLGIRLHDTLVAAGTCPTCGQDTTDK